MKKYGYTMAWKSWQLIKLTLGIWDRELVDVMQVKSRSLKLDINKADSDEKHEEMFSTVGTSQTLVWQFLPYSK